MISVNSIIEVYLASQLLEEYVPLPGTDPKPRGSSLRDVTETYLLKSWFATSLMTNILVTALIIWRIFRPLRTTGPIRAMSVKFDLPDGNRQVAEDDGGRDDPRERDGGVRLRMSMPTWTHRFWRKWRYGDRWHWQSLYTRVIVILIEAALPPALCGVASAIAFYSKVSVVKPQFRRPGRDWGQEVFVRLFLTLWLGTSVCLSFLVGGLARIVLISFTLLFYQVLAPQLIAIHALHKRQRSMLGVDSLSSARGATERHRLEPLAFRDEHGVETQTTDEGAFNGSPAELSRQDGEHL
jgi:hypothetical protein